MPMQPVSALSGRAKRGEKPDTAPQYLVDQKAEYADDQGPGTADRPFQTISAGVARLKPGDTLSIKAGVYREAVDVTVSGTKDAPITIQAAEGEHVVVTGADLVKGWKRFDNPDNKPVWRISPFKPWTTFSYNPYKGHGRGEGPQLVFDNRLMDEAPSLDDLGVASFYVDRSGDGAIYFWAPPGRSSEFVTAEGAEWWDSPVNAASEDPNEHQVELSTRTYCLRANGVSRLHVKGLHLRYTTGLAQRGALQLTGEHNSDTEFGEGCVVENCVIEFSHGRGFTVSGRAMTVRNVMSRYNGASGAGGRLTNSLWENVCLIANTTRDHDHGWEAGGVKFMRANGLTVRNCQFIDNNGPGLWFDWDNSEITIERCFCCGNSSAGIKMEVSPGFGSGDDNAKRQVLPEYNANDHRGTRATDTREPRPTIIRNNICVNTRYDGTWGSGIELQLSSGTLVYNNTCVGNEAYGIFVRYHPFDVRGHRNVDNAIVNNIVANNGSSQIYVSPPPADKPAYVRDITVDYNLYFDSRTWDIERRHEPFPCSGVAQRYAQWGKTQSTSWAAREWFLMYGYDEHAVQSDPRFTSISARDFRVLADSLAIGAGKRLKEVTEDFLGRSRPGNRPPTIGAIEFFGDDLPRIPSHPGAQPWS
ncbi:MAG: hypothetical protein GF418_08025 [Chitinivibrionales bacterium]|nr:hypothetical protein [Chitinivibrionales bacterium]MBD3395560.1 hypothetical protein [Chitinivibrionales bacterium]